MIHNGFGSIELDTKKEFTKSYNLGIRQRTLRVWEDQQHRIWIGNVNGLFQFKNNQLIPPEPFHEVFETRVEDIGELQDGTLAIATKGEGLLLWKDSTLQQLTTDEGLSTNMLENVHVDEQDRIWVGTLEGLNEIVQKDDDYVVKKYTTFHGLPSNEVTRVTSHQNQVWVATTKGLMHWKDKPRSERSIPPLFTRILINNQPVDLQNQQTLSHRDNNIVFHFLTINYNQNGKILYRFRLNKEEWNYTTDRSINFVDLPPGTYKLEVQSQNEDDVWSASTQMQYSIRPAFWQTKWFTFLWIGVLFGILWLIYYNRIRQVQEAAKVEKEMNELQRAALRAQMNPHFIFNCLNSIQNFISQNDRYNATRYLAKFAQLIRDILNASMEERISLEEEIKILENYLTLEKLRFKNKFEYQIQVDPKLDPFEVSIPPLLTQPFVENAILHGISEKDSGGQIQVDFYQKENRLEIEIKDNGMGIFESQKQKKSAQSLHKGVGMSISQKRLKLGDSLNEVEVQEIKNNGKVEGTCVRLNLEL